MSSATRSEVHVLTAAGRRGLEERLRDGTTELAHLDKRIKDGDASVEDLAARARLHEQILAWTGVLHSASDVAAVDEDPSIVEVGDEVDVQEPDGDLLTYAIVDPAEADADRHRISAASPLGRALLGAGVGDRVRVDAPAGPYTFVVLARRRLA